MTRDGNGDPGKPGGHPLAQPRQQVKRACGGFFARAGSIGDAGVRS